MPRKKQESGWLYGLVYEGNGKKWTFVVDSKKPMSKPEVAVHLQTLMDSIEKREVTLKGIRIRRAKRWTLS